jgi:hypothetical protein
MLNRIVIYSVQFRMVLLESIEQSSISSEPVANARGILRWLQDISTSQE